MATAGNESIHDLFKRVREHPDYVFGVIFVPDDFPDGKVVWDESAGPKWAEEHITEAGFEYIELGTPETDDQKLYREQLLAGDEDDDDVPGSRDEEGE